MNPLSEESRKRMTEFLGECWHEFIDDAYDHIRCYSEFTGEYCKKCGTKFLRNNYNLWAKQRTFTTGNDMLNLKEKLVEKGEWDEFEDFALSKKNEKYVSVVSLTDYLINPAIFIPLAIEFLKEERS